MWAMSAAGTAIVIVSVLFTYSGGRRLENLVPKDSTQTKEPRESQPPIQPGEAIQPRPGAPTPPPEPKYEIVLLDLRNASATRTIEPVGPGSNTRPIDITRGLLALLVQLPVGSDAGPYEVQIRDANQQPIRTAKGEATIENGITKISINVDTRSVPPGEYELAWRQADFSWRHYPISIR